MNKIYIYIILFLSSASFAQEFTARLDSNHLVVGAQAKLTLSYKGENNFNWTYFNDNEEIIKNLEVVRSGEFDTLELNNDQIHLQQTLFITAWDSGYFAIPPFSIDIDNTKIESNPLLIQFSLEAIEENGEIKPIKNQVDTPFIFDEIKTHVYWIGGVLLFLFALVILIIYLVKRSLKQPHEEIVKVGPPKIEILWRRFENLSKNKSWTTGEEKEFQVELSLLLREFLELKYNIQAVESTTLEITTQLSGIGIDSKTLDDCKHILNLSDMIKFAKHKGAESQHEHALATLKSFLESYTDVE